MTVGTFDANFSTTVRSPLVGLQTGCLTKGNKLSPSYSVCPLSRFLSFPGLGSRKAGGMNDCESKYCDSKISLCTLFSHLFPQFLVQAKLVTKAVYIAAVRSCLRAQF